MKFAITVIWNVLEAGGWILGARRKRIWMHSLSRQQIYLPIFADYEKTADSGISLSRSAVTESSSLWFDYSSSDCFVDPEIFRCWSRDLRCQWQILDIQKTQTLCLEDLDHITVWLSGTSHTPQIRAINHLSWYATTIWTPETARLKLDAKLHKRNVNVMMRFDNCAEPDNLHIFNLFQKPQLSLSSFFPPWQTTKNLFEVLWVSPSYHGTNFVGWITPDAHPLPNR